MTQILPILKPVQELKTQQERQMFTSNLMEFPDSPFVMFGKDHGAMMAYESSKGGIEDEKIKEIAISNLKQIQIPIQIQSVNGLKFAFCEHEYAAEKILDQEFVKNLATQLQSEEIAVGIPAKGFIAATPHNSGIKKFAAVIQKQYDNAITYPISRHVYIAKNGELINAGGDPSRDDSSAGKPWWKFW